MTRFVEDTIRRAGLLPLLNARRAGELETVRGTLATYKNADLLLLGALADMVRAEEVGEVVNVHAASRGTTVTWVDTEGSELDLLRAVAIARITADKAARVGVDWGRRGLELAQVALGFGASDLAGPIRKKSGLPILADEAKKVKGQGMVELATLKKREIALLLKHQGRLAVFVDDEGANTARHDARESSEVLGA